MFQRNVLYLSSGLKDKPANRKQIYYLLLAHSAQALAVKTGNTSHQYMASLPGR
jgi:hypothetical protein